MIVMVQNGVRFSSRYLDGTLMYPGSYELTWLCLLPCGVRMLLSVVAEGDE